jgi:putative Holliday junction resolvase
LRILSLDIGDSKIGTAMSDPMQIIASPLGVILRREDGEAIRDIVELVEKHQVGTIVCGLPVTLSGTDSEQTTKVRKFVDNLKKIAPVPVVYWNEGLSTVTAQNMMKENGGKRRVGEPDDSVAAAVILQEYLLATMQHDTN